MPSSPSPSPLWPAPLHHLALRSPDPGRLADFLAVTLRMRREPAPGGCASSGDGGSSGGRASSGGGAVLVGPGRIIVVEPGPEPGARHVAFGMDDPARVEALRARFTSRGVPTEPADSPFFRPGSFRVSAPDGVALVFGAPGEPIPAAEAGGPAGRLQHAVFRTPAPEPLLSFLIDEAGFVLSDRVEDEARALTAGFVRSDPEHHSFAAFRASRPAFDHFALETDGWSDLRDWADHFAALRVPIWWGPGRHGPGNNLFLMIRDPDGNRIEVSAELEHMDRDVPHRVWPDEERTLNLWGTAWKRA